MNADFYRQMLDGVGNTRPYSPAANYNQMSRFGETPDMVDSMTERALGLDRSRGMQQPMMGLPALGAYGVDFGGYEQAYDTLPNGQIENQGFVGQGYDEQSPVNDLLLGNAGTDNPVVYDAFLGGY